ncbi:2TM domain-containing protein [Chloroflexota bacterium]
MVKQMSEDEIYKQAKKRVEEKKGFYWNLAAYLVVNPVLVLIWAFAAGGGYPWFLWVIGGWGMVLLFQFLAVFVLGGKSDRVAVEKEMEKIKREQE